VAANQPVLDKNRMTTSLAPLCERVTSFIHRSSGGDFLHADVDVREFEKLALEVFNFQFQENPTYRRMCEARKARPGLVTSWQQIPAVPAAAFKEFELTCLSPADRTHVFHSSGTTNQQRSRHFHGQESLAVYEASLLPWFRRHLLREEEASNRSVDFYSLTPAAKDAPQSSLAHMIDAVTQACGGTASRSFGSVDREGQWSIEANLLLDALAAIQRPVLLLGTAFNFVHLLDAMEAGQLELKLPEGSRVMETGGYKGRSRELPKDALHAELSRRLGLPASALICEYGMSELSSQAYDLAVDAQHPLDRWFRFPPWCRFQIINPESGLPCPEGAPGLLRIFDLANVASVIAVQTEDLAIQRGNGFELLGRAARADARGCSLMTA
jgi:Acyl-protein synthetase, LuxE